MSIVTTIMMILIAPVLVNVGWPVIIFMMLMEMLFYSLIF